MTTKQFAIDIAKQAGRIMRPAFRQGAAMKKEWKGDGSPVTLTDKKVNRLVIEKVKEFFPKHGILGEEESFHPEREMLWVCDPVDGTLPFAHGIPLFAFSLALVKDGKPILGVIYDVMADNMYFAEKNRGAFLNGKIIRVNKNPETLIMGWDEKTLSSVKKLLPQANLLNLYSICYEGILVASGQISGAFIPGGGAHDAAALKVIVEEAGGKVTDKYGKEQRYDQRLKGVLISNNKIHTRLLKIIKNF